ncbi:MAG: hypothetical protein KDJ77_10040 [Rhodobiaceae bacterium]|nr:hypothetical protein [Rhodobiaceae bacterium]
MVNLFNYHYGITDQQAATMVSHYGEMPEVWGGLAAVRARPIDRPWVVSRIITQEALRETAYYRNWVAPMALVDGAALVLARDRYLMGSIRLATDAQVGMIDDQLIEALALILPHCQRAARISGLLDVSRSAVRNFQAVIDSMSTPIVLVSFDCSVVHANPAGQALLEEGQVLALRAGRLASPVRDLQRVIGDTISQLGQDETNIPWRGFGLSVRARDDSLRTLHLLPLAQGDLRTKLAWDAAAAIFVSKGSVEQNLAQDLLQSMFRLTNAEVGVLERILAGKSTQEIATELGVASGTVRTHVLHLFQKTATHSRADLVRLAHSLSSPAAQ